MDNLPATTGADSSGIKREPRDWQQLVVPPDALGEEHHRRKRRLKHESGSESRRAKTKEEAKPATLWIEEAGLVPEKAYRVDRKGDRSNWQYGSLYRLDVANYRRHFRDFCAGLSDIDWEKDGHESGKTKKKRKNRGNVEGRYCAPEAVAVEADMTVKRFHLRGKASSQDDTVAVEPNVTGLKTFQVDDYLPLPADDNQQESSTAWSSLVLLSSGQPAVIPSTSQDSDGHPVSIAERNTIQTKYFNETLRDNPTDVQTWLAYSNFQATEGIWQTEGEVSVAATGKKDRVTAAAERRVAILEKALMKNPRNTELLKEHLNTCSIVWDGQQLAERWKEVVFKHPNSCQLWVGYLQFAQSRFSTFNVRSVQSLYNKCFTTLTNIVDRTMKSHTPEEGTENTVLDLFCSQCHFLWQAGHAERAVACFQAQIEFNWFCPADFESTPSSGQLAFLETYWDSGAPQFGHPQAQHWNQWFARQKDPSMPLASSKLDGSFSMDDSDGDVDLAIPGISTSHGWVLTERHREATNFLPWHPNATKGETEDDCPDPDRMVLFDDISSSLFKFGTHNLKYQLLIRFIEFVSGLQLLRDAPCQLQALTNIDNLHLRSSVVYHSILYGAAVQGIQCVTHQIGECYKQPASKQLTSFIRCAFSQILDVVVGHEYTDVVLKVVDFELSLLGLATKPQNPKKLTKKQKDGLKGVKKWLKAILKVPANRNNLTLWAAYSYIEVSAGNYREASQVLGAALEQATAKGIPSDAIAKMELAMVFRAYVETEISDFFETSDSRRKEQGLISLVVFAEGTAFHHQGMLSTVSSTRVVKAQKLCNEMMMSLLSQYSTSKEAVLLETVIEVSTCCALMQYLTRGKDECLATFRTAIEQLKLASAPMSSTKRLYMALIGLLWCHSNAYPSPQRMMREVLQEAIHSFPDDIQVFALYTELENSLHVVGRLRRSMDVTLKQGTTPVPWLVSILTEWNNAKKRTAAPGSHQLPVTGFVHRIRSLFDRATDQPNTRHCLLLWRLFMLFEVTRTVSVLLLL